MYYDIICNTLIGLSGNVTVFVNPKEISKATGNKRTNILKIKEATGINIKISGDEKLKKREVKCTCY